MKSALEALKPQLIREEVEHLAIFGSRARGDHRDDGDLDVLLDVSPESRFSLLDLVGVEAMVSDAIGIQTHATMRRSLEAKFRNVIEGDVIEMFDERLPP